MTSLFLRYAHQARTIVNVARINEDPNARIIRGGGGGGGEGGGVREERGVEGGKVFGRDGGCREREREGGREGKRERDRDRETVRKGEGGKCSEGGVN